MSNEMIKIKKGFQYSVNIAYDLHNESKLKSFIPTTSSLKLLEEIILSTNDESTNRARVIVGAYGKGKSHIMLAILSLLEGIPIEKCDRIQKKLEANEKLKILIQNYSESDKKLLPVLITGISSSISQSFLLALQRTLHENNLLNLMPETNFKAAIKTIERWKSEYTETYTAFENQISEKDGEALILRLKDFDPNAYKEFEEIYPTLTSGSPFNPFLGFDVTEIYESVAKSLKAKTEYSGLYVVYDEFSKYLETNISTATISDTKTLQDFAEKCNRSGDNQMHLVLICHKEISNYIDTLPKQKIDGWRGISERFTHIHLNNNFTQTYEIIENVILKDTEQWDTFCKSHENKFDDLVKLYSQDSAFSDISKAELHTIFKGCYPLHPLSIYILPRLSERVAQNERTLFTFLSSPNANGLVQWLNSKVSATDFQLLTPDLLYDYFEPLFKKEIYTEDLYKMYSLTATLLDKLQDSSLESKIVKLLSLIYILSQFERLPPNNDTIHNAFSDSYSRDEIDKAINNLIEKDCIIYLKRSNSFYSLKRSSGINIQNEVEKAIASQEKNFSLKRIVNGCSFEKALYPLRYNDEKEMTRYFPFIFIEEDEISEATDWTEKIKNIKGDGVVFAVLRNKDSNMPSIQEKLKNGKESAKRCLFIIPKTHQNLLAIAKEYNAVKNLLDSTESDTVLHDEYEVILYDLQEIINEFISHYIHCEKRQAVYFYDGEERSFQRKSDITEFLSQCCEKYFPNTPIIINESVNKNEISTAAFNARSKIISALLRNELEKNLGLTGGQELAIMRSLLTKTHVVDTESDSPKINLNPNDENMKKVLQTIVDFIIHAKSERKSFAILYDDLTTDKKGIGLRKGVIPVYVACAFHEYKKQIVIYCNEFETNVSLETIIAINENPHNFTMRFIDWGENEEHFIADLKTLFRDFVNETENSINSCDTVFNAIRSWYLNLPKHTRETKFEMNGKEIPRKYVKFLQSIKLSQNAREFIFEKLQSLFSVTKELSKAKEYFDSYIDREMAIFSEKVCEMFDCQSDFASSDLASEQMAEENPFRSNLSKTLERWTESLNPKVFEKVFANGAERFLNMCKSKSLSEKYLQSQMAFVATGLRFEDWKDTTIEAALKNIKSFKEAVEKENENLEHPSFGENPNANQNAPAVPSISSGNMYEIHFVAKDGSAATRRFEKTEISSKANILSNSIKNTISGMGLSITESEKRQVLIDLLIKMCEGETKDGIF